MTFIISNMPITRVNQIIFDMYVLLNKNREEYSQVFSSDRKKFKLLSLDRRICVSIRVLCSHCIFCALLPKRVTFSYPEINTASIGIYIVHTYIYR